MKLDFSSTVLSYIRRHAMVLSAICVIICGYALTQRPSIQITTTRTVGSTQEIIFPGAEWQSISSPESVGYSKERLDSVLAYIKGLPTTAVVAAVHGKILLQYGDVTEQSYIASVRKSVLSMLFGNYVASGKVNLDKTLANLKIDDIGGLSNQEKEATIADLLSARSGVYHPASNSGDNLADAPPRGSQKHGTYYLYSNWDFNALGTIFEQETGRNIYDAVESELAKPIAMQDFKRDLQRKSGDLTKSQHPAYHMWFSTRDMARIGYLMLRDGNWAGKQLVPKDWVKQITTPVTRWNEMNPASLRNGRFGYGYLWWIFDGPKAVGAYEGAFTGIGAGGQFITVMPKMDMVIAHKVNTSTTRGTVSREQYLHVIELLIAAKTNK